MKRLIFASVTLVVASLAMVASAGAQSTTTICVPEASSKPVLSTNTKGECPTKATKVPVKYKSALLPDAGELEALQKILPHLNYIESGAAGKPTIQFSGVNVQIVNGEGKTGSTNGEGNLVLGYDETNGKREQTGSHNVVLGVEQDFKSYGGVVAGAYNTTNAPYASVTGGHENDASGAYASVSGGWRNTANGEYASVSGGFSTLAQGEFSSVSGGWANEARGPAASVSGGQQNTATGQSASVSGGAVNFAANNFAWVGGGALNRAEGMFSTIFGGKELTTKGEYEAIP